MFFPMIAYAEFKKTGVLSAILILFLLGPLGLLLRTQQPWSCFNLTFDESFYLQGIVNWSQGNGFKLYDMAKEFDPTMSIGHPMAWAISGLHRFAGLDWPQAGRVWVHLNFYALLILLGVWTWKRSKNSWSVVLALASIGYLFGAHPAGNYLTYGVLGEIPGALIAWVSLLMITTRRYVWAGPLAILAFFIKPSYIFFIPAVVIASFIWDRKKGLRILGSAALTGLLLLAFICFKRGETPFEYARVFLSGAKRVSETTSLGTELKFFWSLGGAVLLSIFGTVALALAGCRPLFKLKQWKWAKGVFSTPMGPAELGAWILFAFGLIHYLVFWHAPQPKHWFVFYNLGVAAACIRGSLWLGPQLAQRLDERVARTVFCAVLLTWLVNVPGRNIRDFKNTPVLGCAVKEQRALESEIIYLKNFGRLSEKNLTVNSDPALRGFLFGLGWNPKAANSWKEMPKPTHWVAGDIATLYPLHEDCKTYWKGKHAALAICKF